jgi:hypothetical protein
MQKLDDAGARKAIMEGGAGNLQRHLSAMGGALAPNGPPFDGGATCTWVADVLQVVPRATWRGILDRNEQASSEPFVALWRRTDDDGRAFRSFEPSELPAEAEVPLRQLATASSNHAVAARVFDVLWVRFRRPSDAGAAVARYLAYPPQIDEEGWCDLVSALGRLGTLAVARKDSFRVRDVLAAYEHGADTLLGGCCSFAFGQLADALLSTILSNRWARDELQLDVARWVGALVFCAAAYEKDHHHGLNLLEVASGWPRWAHRATDADNLRRTMVEWLIAIAQTNSAGHGSMHLERVLALAGDFGLKDLVVRCRHLLPDAIRTSTAEMKEISSTVSLPLELRSQVDEILELAPSLPAALRQLSAIAGPLDLPVEMVEEAAANSLAQAPFLAMIRSVKYRDGKIAFLGNTPEARLRESVGRTAGFHLVLVELLLHYFLQRSMDRFTETTLSESLAAWPHLGRKQGEVLGVASRQFAAQDWVSAGFIVATTFEAVLRSLMRACGYPALKGGSSGVLMDETLPSLLQQDAVRSILGRDLVWFAEHVFCRPDIGLNLRNEIAHGNIGAADLNATRVLLMWLFVLRVTCFCVPSSSSVPSPSQDEGPESVTDTTSD